MFAFYQYCIKKTLRGGMKIIYFRSTLIITISYNVGPCIEHSNHTFSQQPLLHILFVCQFPYYNYFVTVRQYVELCMPEDETREKMCEYNTKITMYTQT